jgi:hypothetical protein
MQKLMLCPDIVCCGGFKGMRGMLKSRFETSLAGSTKVVTLRIAVGMVAESAPWSRHGTSGAPFEMRRIDLGVA